MFDCHFPMRYDPKKRFTKKVRFGVPVWANDGTWGYFRQGGIPSTADEEGSFHHCCQMFRHSLLDGLLKNLCSWLGWSPSVQISSALVCSPSQRLLLYMYLSQLMSTFTNYLKVLHSLEGYFIQWPRRTSDPAITHLFPYTLVSQNKDT